MKNIGLQRFLDSNENNFTSNIGIVLRQKSNFLLRKILKVMIKQDVILHNYPKLNEKQNNIFVSNHSFGEDIVACLSIIDRNAYLLMGTTNQIEYNPQVYAAWLNGMIYVDRNNSNSRKNSIEKMTRILNSGSSVLIFPEGGWNNTENLLVQKLFASPYILSCRTGVKVVPITCLKTDQNRIHICVEEPLDLNIYHKKEALSILRDKIASHYWNMLEAHTTVFCRDEIDDLGRLKYMEERKNEYMYVNWTRDVWDEELTIYKDNDDIWDIRKSILNVKISKQNANLLVPEVLKYLEEQRYDFKKHMRVI
jgi:1-acyl-sn-glycerol-3-phosphate acyltransferase